MTIAPTSASPSVGNLLSSPPIEKVLGQEDFFKLLTTQLSSQDPLNPMADTEFISQMANFSSLTLMKELTQSFAAFTNEQRYAAAQAFLGREVTLLGNDGMETTGVVSAVSFEQGRPILLVGGSPWDPSAVQRVSLPASANPL